MNKNSAQRNLELFTLVAHRLEELRDEVIRDHQFRKVKWTSIKLHC